MPLLVASETWDKNLDQLNPNPSTALSTITAVSGHLRLIEGLAADGGHFHYTEQLRKSRPAAIKAFYKKPWISPTVAVEGKSFSKVHYVWSEGLWIRLLCHKVTGGLFKRSSGWTCVCSRAYLLQHTHKHQPQRSETLNFIKPLVMPFMPKTALHNEPPAAL